MKPSPAIHPLARALAGIALLAHGSLCAAPGDIAPGWPVATDGVIFGAPAIGPHGEIVFGSEDNQIYSFNPDGTRRWVYATGDWVDSSPAIAPDGTVYAGSWDNFLYALDGETGALKWRHETGSLITASPAIGPDGTIYVASHDALLYALHPNGTLKWTFQPDYYDSALLKTVLDLNPINSSPVLNATADTLYFGTDGGNLYAVNTLNGSKRWVYQVLALTGQKAVTGSPAIDPEGTIFFTCENGNLYSLKPTGQLNWWFPTSESLKSSPVLNGSGAVYFAGQDGFLYAVDEFGVELWETYVGDVFYCTPAIDASGNLIVAGYAGSAVIGAASAFTCVDPLGNVLWEKIIYGYNDSSPNIAPDGSIYIGAHDGLLYKLQGVAGLNRHGWPRLQGNRRQTGWGNDLKDMSLVDYFPAAAVALNDWVYVPWFGSGWLTDSTLPWVQHLDHGFIYVVAPSVWAVYFYDGALAEWFYAPSFAPNFYYRFSTGSWLYHWPGTSVGTGRWFYDYSRGIWYPEAEL